MFDFCVLTFYPIILLNLFFLGDFCRFFGIFYTDDHVKRTWQSKTVLFLPFQSLCLLFIFLALLHLLELSKQSQIIVEVMRIDTLALVPVLRGKHSVIPHCYDVSMLLAVGFLAALYQAEEVPDS